MIHFSIIVIANKLGVYNGFVKSLNKQKGIVYELIKIDNFDNHWTSARKAYNKALKEARGKYVIFTHPDIRFLTIHSLEDIWKNIEKIEQFGVVGIAGCPEWLEKKKRVLLSNILHGENKKNAGKHIQGAVTVQTVDECFFIVNNKEDLFSEREGWHLYAVELCLSNIVNGNSNYVIPADIWHMSNGNSLDKNYIKILKELIKEYGNSFDTINTTVKKWNISTLSGRLYISYYYIKQYIKGKILK